MFAFNTPDITDNIQPFFFRSTSTPHPEEITLATFVPQGELSELSALVDRFAGLCTSHGFRVRLSHPAVLACFLFLI